jgi:hypothetical protein
MEDTKYFKMGYASFARELANDNSLDDFPPNTGETSDIVNMTEYCHGYEAAKNEHFKPMINAFESELQTLCKKYNVKMDEFHGYIEKNEIECNVYLYKNEVFR